MLIDFTADPRKAYGWMSSAIAPRPIAWVCTRSKDGVVNLAPFSFFQMVTGTPPTLMISPLLQGDGSLKDTTRNIIETGEFVVNLVPHDLREKMNETSFSFPAGVSEVEQCGIATLAAERVQPPRIVGVPVSFECRVASVLPYPADKPSCHIILGEVLVAHIDERVLDEQGHIDPRRLDLISRMGGDWYGRIDSTDNFRMARPQGWDQRATSPIPKETAGAGTHFDAAERYRMQDQFADAERAYQEATRIKPDYVEAWLHLGLVQQVQRKFDDAQASIGKALALNPLLPQAHMNRGAVFHALDQIEQAILSYRHAILCEPQWATAYYNASVALHDVGRYAEAEIACRHALVIDPGYVDAHFQLARVLLQKGDFAQGWREYEYRWLLKTAHKIVEPQAPLWDGTFDLQGKTILIHVEQGLGDTLQFARYAQLLVERGAKVWAAVPPELRTLMQRCDGVSAVFCSSDELLPGYDCHCPLLSLPLLLQTELHNIPSRVPYLSSDPATRTLWRQRIGEKTVMRVGLVWAGGQHNNAAMAYAIDRLRSLHFDQLKPLLEIDDIEFFSLQMGKEAQAQLADHAKVKDFTALIRDFGDTAGLIDHLDLVISVDTSVAHLAGALAKPVWLLNRFNACWRWLLNRSDSPWYPTMRIFSQPSFGDWDSVIDEVVQALREYVAITRQAQPSSMIPISDTAAVTDAMQASAALQLALIHHQAGRLQQAETQYRQILAAQPRHADALHYLGMLAHQRGKQQEAIGLIAQAIEAQPDNPLYHCNLGTIYRQNGDLVAAISSYRKAVALKDDYADAHYKLGISYQQTLQLEQAEQSYRQVIALASDNAGAHNNLGSVLREMGRVADAEASYREALRIKPDFVDVYLNFGNLLKDSGKLDHAEINYRMALQLQPGYTEAHSNLAVLLVQQERYEEAERHYRQALALQPDSVEILGNLGFAMVEQHRYAEAEQCFRDALQLQPEFAEGYNNLGIVLREQGKVDDAEEAFRKAIAINSALLVAHNHLGNLLKQSFRFDDAYDVFATALKIDPEFAPTYSNLGVLLQELSRPVEAEAHFRRALQIDPDFGFAHHNLAIVLRDQGRLAEAEASCLRALELDPEHMDVQFHHTFLLLQKGDYAAGWPKFEYRWQLEHTDCTLERRLSEPKWDGQADIAGKRILLYAEQGYGDTIQMARYTQLVAERGATVLLIVTQELNSLMARCAGVSATVSSLADVPGEFDYRIPLMSLPLAFGTELTSIPNELPYLSVDPALLHQWKVLLGERNGLRVGLVWAGNPRNNLPGAQVVDRQRSLHFDQLAPLLEIDGIEFFSLQMGEAASVQLAQHSKVTDYTGLIRDFHDTAALIDSLDLVISVDTAVAHLAGALAKPVWMLNRFNSCWRWLLERNDSPWYPTMRIFRQARFGEWDNVIDDVAQALRELLASSAKQQDMSLPVTVNDDTMSVELVSGQSTGELQQALAHHQAGRLQQAEALYRQILSAQPRHADALHYLGMLAHQVGRQQEAIGLITQAIEAQPDHPLYHCNLGTIYRQSGDLQASIRSYRKAIALKDDYVDAHYKLGISYQHAQQLELAEQSYRQVIALDSDHVSAYNNLGCVLYEMGRFAEAEASYRQVLRIKPDFADAYLNFGNLLKDNGKLRDAEMHYRMAIELTPNNAQAHNNLGVLLVQMRQYDEAERCYLNGMALQPDSVEIRSNLGFAMAEQHRFIEAEQHFRAALKLEPGFASGYNNLGIVLRELDRLDEAETAFRLALQLNPSHSEAYNNLGNLLREQERIDEAERYYLHALSVTPGFHDARVNYSLTLLQRGDFLNGWKEYEHRWNGVNSEPPRSYVQPLWDGTGDVHGKTILIHAEQGFGDTLQFVRYATLLKERGATVIVLVPEEIQSLLMRCTGVAASITSGQPLPEFDWHCPMMSLPLAFKTEVASIPSQVPYLAASEIGIERWRKLLGEKTALRVGLVWAGSPRKNQPAAQLIDQRRSMQFDTIKPLLDVPGIHFISLQLGEEARAQIDPMVPLRDVADELRNFEETAALIANLDLVISVDTSVAHLAGALGKPVWLLNRYNTCWRWFSERSDSPWYPSMRIFRQATMGDWPGVIADVQTALKQWAVTSNTSTMQTQAKRKKKR